jgi:hypothetical protein
MHCGTPLFLSYDGRPDIAFTVGSFDTPDTVSPTHHYGAESRLRWVDIGAGLPTRSTKEQW